MRAALELLVETGKERKEDEQNTSKFNFSKHSAERQRPSSLRKMSVRALMGAGAVTGFAFDHHVDSARHHDLHSRAS
jgi:hypothetical protein